jgi:uncharacterized membrane protein
MHPAFVHFPIALLMVSLVLELIAVVSRREQLARCAGIVLLLAVLGAVAAVITGLMAEEVVEAQVEKTAAADLLAAHRIAALVVTGLALLLVVWRLTLRLEPPKGARRWLYLAVLLAACVLVGATGRLGGTMVYGHGVGVSPVMERPAPPPPPQ